MNDEYLEKRNRLNRVMRRLQVSSRSRGDIQRIIDLAKQTQYKCLLGELNPNCKIPTGISEVGQIILCGSPATQASHSIQRPILASISDPGLGPDGRELPNSTVLEIFPKDPEYWQGVALKEEWLWNVGSVPPQPRRPRGASIRPFACNCHDRDTFRDIEGKSGMLFPAPGTSLTFSSSGCSGLEGLEKQLFLLAYRAILFHQDILNSLQQSLLLPINERNPTRRTLRARLHQTRSTAINPVREAVEKAKAEYDARNLGVRQMCLHHRLIPLQTAAAATASDVIVEQRSSGAFGHIALTLLPTEVETREHWLILSYPEGDGDWLSDTADRIQAYAEESQKSETARVDWLVWLLRHSTNSYLKPSHYHKLPDAARTEIEEKLVEPIIDSSVEWVTELEKLVTHPPPRHSSRPRRNRGRRHRGR